jgi:hypothetical protein
MIRSAAARLQVEWARAAVRTARHGTASRDTHGGDPSSSHERVSLARRHEGRPWLEIGERGLAE